MRRLAREGSERVLRRVFLGQGLARPDAAADARVADGDVAGEPAPRRRRRVGESERGTETVAELLELWKSKFYGAFVLNQNVVLHAIDATPAR